MHCKRCALSRWYHMDGYLTCLFLLNFNWDNYERLVSVRSAKNCQISLRLNTLKMSNVIPLDGLLLFFENWEVWKFLMSKNIFYIFKTFTAMVCYQLKNVKQLDGGRNSFIVSQISILFYNWSQNFSQTDRQTDRGTDKFFDTSYGGVPIFSLSYISFLPTCFARSGLKEHNSVAIKRKDLTSV